MNVLDAIRRRSSTRAFESRPVARETVDALLEVARWAPSGVNTQPWRVHIVTDAPKRRIGDDIIAQREQGIEPNPDYAYYPEHWVEPYKSRRLATGLALYGALNIERHDKDARKRAWYANYRFFDAPVGLLFFIDRRMAQGSWVDMGMFIENVMLAALGFDLATCPQASLAEYPDVVRGIIDVSSDWALVCGMALGYPDEDAPVNQYRTERTELETFRHWHS